MGKTSTYLRLMRPANIVTALADVLTGSGIVGITYLTAYPVEEIPLLVYLPLLLISVAALYASGVIFNDVLDASLDKIERPERPIPQGIITIKQASLVASILALIGILAASYVSWASGLIALLIALLSIIYDAYSKHSIWLGPLNMGLCRSGSLLLGISIVPAALTVYWPLLFIPLCYIAGVTLISKGEVQVGSRTFLWVALLLYLLTIAGVVLLVYTPHFNLTHSIPFLFIFALIILASVIQAIKTLDPAKLRKAVKIGILSLIILDAAITAGYAGWWYGLLILLMLPITIVLAKLFAVT